MAEEPATEELDYLEEIAAYRRRRSALEQDRANARAAIIGAPTNQRKPHLDRIKECNAGIQELIAEIKKIEEANKEK